MKKRVLSILLAGILTFSSSGMTMVTAYATEGQSTTAETDTEASTASATTEAETAVSTGATEDAASEGMTEASASEGTTEAVPSEGSTEDAAAEGSTEVATTEDSAEQTSTMQEQEEVKEYTVTFDTNGGMFADGSTTYSVSVSEEATITNVPENPTWEGYDFTGWFTSTDTVTASAEDAGTDVAEEETGVEAEAQAVTLDDSFVITSDLTLYAGWEEDTIETQAKPNENALGIVQLYYSYSFTDEGGSQISDSIGEDVYDEEWSDVERTASLDVAPVKNGVISIKAYYRTQKDGDAINVLDATKELKLSEKFSSNNTGVANVDSKGTIKLTGKEGVAVVSIQVNQQVEKNKKEIGRLELTIRAYKDTTSYSLGLLNSSLTVAYNKIVGGVIGVVPNVTMSEGYDFTVDPVLYSDKACTKSVAGYEVVEAADVNALETGESASGAKYFEVNATDDKTKGDPVPKAGSYYLNGYFTEGGSKLEGETGDTVMKIKVSLDKSFPTSLKASIASYPSTKKNAFYWSDDNQFQWDYEVYLTVYTCNYITNDEEKDNIGISPSGNGNDCFSFTDQYNYTNSIGDCFQYSVKKTGNNPFDSATFEDDVTGQITYDSIIKKYNISFIPSGYRNPVTTTATLPLTYKLGKFKLDKSSVKIVSGEEKTITIDPQYYYEANEYSQYYNDSMGEGKVVVYDPVTKGYLNADFSSGEGYVIDAGAINSSRTLTVYYKNNNWSGYASTKLKVNIVSSTQYVVTAADDNIATGFGHLGTIKDQAGNAPVNQTTEGDDSGKTYNVDGNIIKVCKNGNYYMQEWAGGEKPATGKYYFSVPLTDETGTDDPIDLGEIKLTFNVVSVQKIYTTRYYQSYKSTSKVTINKPETSGDEKTVDLVISDSNSQYYFEPKVDKSIIQITDSNGKDVTEGDDAPNVKISENGYNSIDLLASNTVTSSTATGVYKVKVTAVNSSDYKSKPVEYELVVTDTEVSSGITAKAVKSIDLAMQTNVSDYGKVEFKVPDKNSYIWSITSVTCDELPETGFSSGMYISGNKRGAMIYIKSGASSIRLKNTPYLFTIKFTVYNKITGETSEVQTLESIPIKIINSRTTFKDSGNHYVNSSMKRISFYGTLKANKSKANVKSVLKSDIDKTPFQIESLENGKYRIYSTYKGTLKKGTYKMKVNVWTDQDSIDYAGSPVTITIVVK